MNISHGQVWRLVGSDTVCSIFKVQDWVDRDNPNSKGTDVWYMVRGHMKSKSLDDFLMNYVYETPVVA